MSTTNTTTPAEPGANPTYSSGDIAWILTSTALVWLMIPGVGYLYSGLAQRKNALSLIMLSVLSIAVVSFQWFLVGFSLTFSKTSNNPIIGNFDNALLRGVLGQPSIGSARVPDLVFCIYQMMFAAITPALAIGAAAERARILPMVVFIFFWSCFVYDFIAYWTWNSNGWSYKLGGLDFAGGTPVHIASGAAGLAYALFIGKRQGHGVEKYRPHNMTNVLLGTVLIWFGWFGFNGGSALGSTMRAAMAFLVTNLSACVGAITWVALDFRSERKYSALGFCSGAVAGLVTITPASGFVGPGPSIVFGVVGAAACNLVVKYKHRFAVDDALDVFALHGIGGIVGDLLTGIFAEKYVAGLDGTEIAGGWLDRNFIQLAYQLADATSGFAWSFVVTYVILFIMNRIPGLSLRIDPDKEGDGIDVAELGEHAYHYYHEITMVNEHGEQRTVLEEIKEPHLRNMSVNHTSASNGEIKSEKENGG
ncbi:uncharacterized protein VTP21DRAFT_9357 [Calcarisporiella thermophila]|uniref:uncharacterized protein n=1 Tax=Calcarisporiella thermophila TaxID=911321 RepID=UPI003742A5D9